MDAAPVCDGNRGTGHFKRFLLFLLVDAQRSCKSQQPKAEWAALAPANSFPSDFVVCKLLKIGGSVCESNTPATSKMPPAGFEDRDDHRTACAYVIRLQWTTNYFGCATTRRYGFRVFQPPGYFCLA